MSDPEVHAKTIFLKAIESYPANEWDAFLEGACLNDPELLKRVKSLLKSHQDADRLFDQYTITERPGTEIGPYKLLQQIGDGGFGVVYMAEQLRPMNRKVALKVIKPGMDTKEVIARFEAERQALAMMDHPNIAKIFDGGVTERGRPYFVMELVHGLPITDFCDENKLPLERRIEIFSDVCKAIQHAHEHGVIHRDIKPSNVMITIQDGQPVPKVIDFGVAKAIEQRLTTKTMFTAFGQMIGTPQYMSPEQAEMSSIDVDTRSDVYSLGVLLYELLTGTTPLQHEQIRDTAYAELRRLVCEVEPPKPSTRISRLGKIAISIASERGTQLEKLGPWLSGDLDSIAMKALDKDRLRRYESAGKLAEDLARHLSHQPVVARPPSVGYRLRKFVHRHRKRAWTLVASFTAALFLIAVIWSAAAYGDWRKGEKLREDALDATSRIQSQPDADGAN